ncbi:hypothetical protein EDF34_2788 [Cellulomonas sp. PhB150]|nr:hypothetical protein EDF34_2788 [Cellulomonas sp. PhB150]
MREALGGSPASQAIGAAKLQSVPELAAASYLIGSEGPEHLRVRSDTFSCGQAFPSAIFYDPAGSGGISLYADVADPFTHESTGTVPTRGTDAHVLTPPAGHHFMTWTEPDGVRWFVIARGMSVAQLASWLDTAPLTGVTVGTDASVPGMTRVPDIAPTPAGPSTVWTWTAEYAGVAPSRVVDGYEDVPAGAVTLDVRVGAVENPAASLSWALPGRVITTVDGAPAWYVPHSEGGSVLAWTKDGATFRLYVGAHTLQASQAIAAQLEHVALGDPRVTSRLTP